MGQDSVDALDLGGAIQDFSIWGLFLEADIVVKIVIVILILASFWTWTIIFDKLIRLRRLRRLADQFEDDFWSGGSLDDLYDRIDRRAADPMAAIFVTAMREWRRTGASGARDDHFKAGLQQRVDRVMDIALNREMEHIEKAMIFLASVGSSAPFIGLFGTVWGIMNAFASIAASKNTSLAVVAPGIAEALFATALGLVAAIPAVIAYNKINNDLQRYEGRLQAFAVEFSTLLSRELEDRT